MPWIPISSDKDAHKVKLKKNVKMMATIEVHLFLCLLCSTHKNQMFNVVAILTFFNYSLQISPNEILKAIALTPTELPWFQISLSSACSPSQKENFAYERRISRQGQEQMLHFFPPHSFIGKKYRDKSSENPNSLQAGRVDPSVI